MTKKEYYEKYKNNNIKTYIKYVLNEYKKAFIDFFGSIGLMIVSLIFIILFPALFTYYVLRRYYFRRKTWKRYVNGDESVLKLVEE